jgi:transposase
MLPRQAVQVADPGARDGRDCLLCLGSRPRRSCLGVRMPGSRHSSRGRCRVIAGQVAVIGRLRQRAGQLGRGAAGDSPDSPGPPSSGSPYGKGREKPRDRPLRGKGKPAPGRQPGGPGTTMRLADNPGYRFWYPPAQCRGCGTGLDGEDVYAQRRHQVTGTGPAPGPGVTGHIAQPKRCPCRGEVTGGALPAHVRARASSGPEGHAQAANLASGNFVPAGRRG